MSSTRAEKKALRRLAAETGDRLVARGLRRPPAMADLVALSFRLLGALGDRKADSACSLAADLAWRAYESSMASDPVKLQLACRKGCSHCCISGPVSVTAPEAFAIAATLAQPRNRPARTRFAEHAPATANLGPRERFGRNISCALLLDDGACSVYAVRPLSCRRVVSFAVEPCIEERAGVAGDMTVPAPPLAHSANVQLALLAAIQARGRPPLLYELSAAVQRILDTPDAERRWASGEPIFDGVAIDEPRAGDAHGLIGKVAAEVQALAD
jgi:Fe-S-cluster containining protein